MYRTRGALMISLAHEVLNRPRASPTAKNKGPALQLTPQKPANVSESDFGCKLEGGLLNEARMVRKEGIAPGPTLVIDNSMPNSKAWDADFLGRRTKAKFRQNSVPQAVAAEGSFEEIYKVLPRLQTPEPDLIFGLSTSLLHPQFCADFDSTEQAKPITPKKFIIAFWRAKARPKIDPSQKQKPNASALVVP
ncbi:hypothetical protein BDR22DRAFT_240923 [Usnea florida]